MSINGEPTLSEVKEWLKVTDELDDVTLDAGLQAALAHQRGILRFPVHTDETSGGDESLVGLPYYPDDLRLAVYLRTARYLARRNSPEGLVGFGEFGPAQVASSDRDVALLESHYVKQVVS